MKLRKIKSLSAIALTVALCAGIFVGCGGSKDAGSKGPAEQKIVFNLGTVVKTIDPALNTAVDGSIVLANAFEGLMRLDEKDNPIPGVAESYEKSKDGKTYTFKLRKDAKWSDGKPVTAKDFEYGWLRALDKKTGSEYAYQLYYIKGAQNFNLGKGKAEDVGVKAVDDYTLKVDLEAPAPYFLGLTAFPTYMPVRKDVLEANGDKWTHSAETYVTNGPFKLAEYKQKDEYAFVKNENYWNKDNVKLEKLTFKMLADDTNGYVNFEKKEFDMVYKLPTPRLEEAKEKGLSQTFANYGTYFVCLNTGNNIDKIDKEVAKVLQNKDVRKALALSIDRKSIVENATKEGQKPSTSFTPSGITKPDGTEFKKDSFDPLAQEANVAEAKKLLEKAGYPGGKGIPTIELMTNSEGVHKDSMAIIQQNWKAIGVEVELKTQEWATFLTSRKAGQFQIARHGWSADYKDPMTFLDMWVSGEAGNQASWGNNESHYSNPKYDELIAKAKKEADETKRMDYLRQAEDILLEDMPVIPIYEYVQVHGIQPYVKGVVVSPLGQLYFDKAYIEEAK